MSPLDFKGFVMLPDKKEWEKEFLSSERYKELTDTIRNYPDYEFLPVWNIKDGWRPAEEKRQRYYVFRIFPLQSFYILDYINKQTNGGTIVNLCEGLNWFANMYNVVNWKSHNTVANDKPNVWRLSEEGVKFDNVFSACGFNSLSFSDFGSFLVRYAELTKDYGYISINSFDLKVFTDSNFIASNELNKYYKLMNFVDGIVDRLSKHVDIINYENLIELEPEHPNNAYDVLDGDIRILFKAKPSTKT